MKKKRRRKSNGRPRQAGRERYASGRARARNEPDTGTSELRRRKMRFTKSAEYPLTLMGILAGRGLISELHYAAAMDLRELWVANYGNPWPRIGNLDAGQSRSGVIATPTPSPSQALRLGVIRQRLHAKKMWACVIAQCIFEQDRWAQRIGGADPMVHILSHDICATKPPVGSLKIHIDLIRDALQTVADSPRR